VAERLAAVLLARKRQSVGVRPKRWKAPGNSSTPAHAGHPC